MLTLNIYYCFPSVTSFWMTQMWTHCMCRCEGYLQTRTGVITWYKHLGELYTTLEPPSLKLWSTAEKLCCLKICGIVKYFWHYCSYFPLRGNNTFCEYGCSFNQVMLVMFRNFMSWSTKIKVMHFVKRYLYGQYLCPASLIVQVILVL